MEQNFTKLLTIETLQEAANLFADNPGSIHLLSDYENLVYECVSSEVPFILRFTHDSHRRHDQIRGELDWISYLADHEIAVTQPIRSKWDKYIETITASDGSQFFVSAFQKIQGESIIEAGMCTPAVYQEWGRIMGKMHHLAKSYVPARSSWQRPSWYENDIIQNFNHYLKGQNKIIEKFRALLDLLAQLPQPQDAYGLIHTDFTDVNFFVNDSKLVVFDFDDCEYHWFAYDIAVVLFDCLPWLPHPGMGLYEFARFFWQHFYAGYMSEHVLEDDWLSLLPRFIKLRQCYLYTDFHRKWDLENLSERRHKMLQEYRFNIENDIDQVKIDFPLP